MMLKKLAQSTRILATWGAATALVLYLLLAPGRGLLLAGPWAAIGLTLIGVAVCAESGRRSGSAS